MKKTNKNNRLDVLFECLRVEGLKIREQLSVGDIVMHQPTIASEQRSLLAIITHIPEDASLNACKIVWLDDLGQTPITVLFNDIMKITKEAF